MTQQNMKEIIKHEFKKCAMSAAYFLSRYSYIQHPIRGRVLFDLYGYQKNAINEFEEHEYNIILKGRQIGISTLVAGYSLWLMLFHNDKNVLVIATKQEVAKNLVTKVRYMHANLPVWLRGNCVEDNKLSMRFSNGSQIKAIASSPDAGRSEALSLLILDECLAANHTIYIKNKHTGEVRNISLGEFYNEQTTDHQTPTDTTL
jgi:phage terminase large subunit-like protein